MLKKTLFLFFILFSSLLFCQTEKEKPYKIEKITQKKYIKRITKTYQNSLNFTIQQKEEFIKILKKYNLLFQSELLKKPVNNYHFNKIYKNYILEINNLLTKDQYKIFFKIKKNVEPFKFYRR